MFCGNCGKELPPHARFCSACGQPVGSRDLTPEPAYTPEPVIENPLPEPELFEEQVFDAPEQPEPVRERPAKKRQPEEEDEPFTVPLLEEQNEPLFRPEPEPELPKENQPLSPWAYFGYGLLFLIPAVGFILLIVFSFNDGNVNRRNFARSYWCSLIPVLAIVLILLVLVMLGVLKGPIEAAIAWLRETGLTWLSNAVN